jgi:hypothetical protein
MKDFPKQYQAKEIEKEISDLHQNKSVKKPEKLLINFPVPISRNLHY